MSHCVGSGWLKRDNYIKCTYLVRIVGGLKSISTFVDVCGEKVNRLRDLHQKLRLLDKGGRVRRYERSSAVKHEQMSGLIDVIVA